MAFGTYLPYLGEVQNLLWPLFVASISTPLGALVMEALHKTNRAAAEYGALAGGGLYYVFLTWLVLSLRKRWVFYLFYLILCGSLLFTAGALLLWRFVGGQ
jgi:hypothetical protein